MKKEEVVLITGCSTGIGRELSRILAEKGYTVAATARNVEALADLPVSMKLPLDVTNKESVEAAVKQVISRYQTIDILVNNAGYSLRGALEEISMEGMKSMFDVNVFGIVNMVQAVAPYMRKNMSGKIINIGSISGKLSQPLNGAYCASKHAVEALSDTLRLELFRFNIQATVVEPGPIETNFFKTLDNNSTYLAQNPESGYASQYIKSAAFRKMQKFAPVQKAAETICGIIAKESLKPRYQIEVPYLHRMIVHFPDTLREYMMKRAL